MVLISKNVSVYNVFAGLKKPFVKTPLSHRITTNTLTGEAR